MANITCRTGSRSVNDFKRGEIYHNGTGSVVMCTRTTCDGPLFEGVLLYNMQIVDHPNIGRYRSDWTKKSFSPWDGTIIIEV